MLQSKLFAKTIKEAPKDEKSINAQFLIRAGYIDKLMAGVYSLLPLGLLVLKKIENIIREEMNAAGGQELYLPSMHPKANWEKTGRLALEQPFNLLKEEIVFAPTHEEVIAPLAKKFINSYKDLPIHLYQIQNKFRNELRAKSGLLRGREFLMKDLYSFHASAADLDEYYEKMRHAYTRIFQRAGLGEVTYYTFASGGSFSKYSHEFQTVTPAGEDIIYICQKCHLAVNKEIKGETPKCPDCGGENFKEEKSIEVGNIFKLMTKYSDPFKLTFKNASGVDQPVIMGCYGLGLQRLMGTVVEVHHDERGIIWPPSIAPFAVHLIGLNLDNPEIHAKMMAVYDDLQKHHLEVLCDDRLEASAGQKFAEADLLGIPARLVISAKTTNKIEYKGRRDEKAEMLELPQVLERIRKANGNV